MYKDGTDRTGQDSATRTVTKRGACIRWTQKRSHPDIFRERVMYE